MGGQSQQLLTDDDRRAHLHTLLGHRIKSSGRLLLPTLEHYAKLSTNEGLQNVGYEICRQIGFKPNGLHVKYADTLLEHGYIVNLDSKTVLVDPQFRIHPYTSGAVLATAITSYAIENFGHETPDKAFIEFATIETGLGLWIINALRPHMSFSQKLYHTIDRSWFHSEGIRLELYGPSQYVEHVVSFAHENHVATDTYLPHVLKRVRYLFPLFVTKQSNRYLPEASIILTHKKAANLLWAKIAMIALLITAGIMLGVYALANREAPPNPELERLHQSISDLKQSYERCQNEAASKQNTYDPNDLFMTRQIDDTKSRCESLRNQYNYAVDKYEELL